MENTAEITTHSLGLPMRDRVVRVNSKPQVKERGRRGKGQGRKKDRQPSVKMRETQGAKGQKTSTGSNREKAQAPGVEFRSPMGYGKAKENRVTKTRVDLII